MEKQMSKRILFVDDDVSILKSFNRSLPKDFSIVTASSPQEGLRVLQDQGPFPVIVSDLKMPEMDGLEFLHLSKEISPDSVRILLTGYADQQTAIDAINRGDLFRFLTKPCDLEMLSSILADGIKQHLLIVAEKELLEQTLFGAIKVLSQILTLISPTAQGYASRLKLYCRHMAEQLGLHENKWIYEIAAMLSQLGCLTMPNEILQKYFSGQPLEAWEEEMIARHPAAATKLLMHIPRLENIAEIISLQNKPYSYLPDNQGENKKSVVETGAQILHIAIGLDRKLMNGAVPSEAIAKMLEEIGQYNPEMVATLRSYDFGLQNMVCMNIRCEELNMRMIINEDIFAKDGMLLVTKGQRITEPILMGLTNYASTVGVKEPFSVLVPILDYV
jgi:response regulator RpfG family c-di-GMP phosphodiesterase